MLHRHYNKKYTNDPEKGGGGMVHRAPTVPTFLPCEKPKAEVDGNVASRFKISLCSEEVRVIVYR